MNTKPPNCRCGHCDGQWRNVLEHAIDAGVDIKDHKAVTRFFNGFTVDTMIGKKEKRDEKRD